MEIKRSILTKEPWPERPTKPFLEVTCSTPTKDSDSSYLPFQQKKEIKWRSPGNFTIRSAAQYGLIVKDVSRFVYFTNPCITWKEPEKVPFMIAECTGEITSKQYDMELFKKWLNDVWYSPVLQTRMSGKTFVTAGAAGMAMFDQLIQQEYGKKTSI